MALLQGGLMKKKTKKLVLAKETLRGLDNRDGLRQVAGGVTVVSGCTDCDPSVGSCDSCVDTCVNNFRG
jgi:hypothetical protein